MNYSADDFLGTTLNIFDLHINGYPVFVFIWNIALAVLTVLLAYWVVRIWQSRQSWLKKLGVFLIWLAFFPNAAYLMTDARHVIGYCPIGSYGRVCPDNAWMALFFFAYAALGWPALVFSLKPLKDFVVKHYGKIHGLIFTLVMCFLGALGILLGLLNRFNSWEIIYKPLNIIKAALVYFYDSTAALNLLIVFLVLFFLYILGEKIFITPKVK